MKRGAVLFALAFFAGCAERDNPFDPLNLPPRQDSGTKDDSWIPKPRNHVYVLKEDSGSKYRGASGYRYVANLAGTLTNMVPDDTLYIYGGGGEYTLNGQITIASKGALGHPIVLLPFGGRVRFRLDLPPESSDYQQYCLKIEDSHVKIVGITCNGGKDYGLMAGGGLLTDGSLELDSVQLENPGKGILVSRLRGPVVIRNLVVQGAAQNVAVPVNLVGNLQLDTSNIIW